MAVNKVATKKETPIKAVRRYPPLSSVKARKLIKAIKRIGCKNERSWREVARLLRLKNHGRAQQIYLGNLRDTPDMLRAIERADIRGQQAYDRAWKMIPPKEYRGVRIEKLYDAFLAIEKIAAAETEEIGNSK